MSKFDKKIIIISSLWLTNQYMVTNSCLKNGSLKSVLQAHVKQIWGHSRLAVELESLGQTQ